jgi:thiosulfate reductase / polysulfide reductase chain A
VSSATPTASSPGKPSMPPSFEERWTHGLIEWWNQELKDRTPEWAETITTIRPGTSARPPRSSAPPGPAMAHLRARPHRPQQRHLQRHGDPCPQRPGGIAVRRGRPGYQMGVPYGALPVSADDYMDTYARNGAWRKQPRIDMARTGRWPMADNMMQETARNHLAGEPYKLDTAMFFLHQPDLVVSGPKGVGGGAQGCLRHRHLALPRRDGDVRRPHPAGVTPTWSACRTRPPTPSRAGR